MSINNATPQDWNNIRDKEFKHRDTITETPKETWNRYVEAAMSEAHEEDVVNKPAHYNAGGVECIEAIKASMSVEAFEGYLKGNCLKYLWRMSYKGKALEDTKKAQWYLQKLIDNIEEI